MPADHDEGLAPRWVDAAELVRRVPPSRARELLRQALADGLDPGLDPPRSAIPVEHGQLLLMPSAGRTAVGAKVLGLAPDNPARGLPLIQGLYVLLDAVTLTPTMLVDGVALTNLRTPAVSAVAMDVLAARDVDSAVVIGSGPQALGHARALLDLRGVRRITVAGRDRGRAAACAGQIATVAAPHQSNAPEVVATVDPGQLAEAVRAAQVVVCATSSATPVVDGAWVSDGACVVAVGTHQPGHRELDSALMARAQVVVEDVPTTLREAGDVVLAVADGALAEADLQTLTDLVRGAVRRATDRPNVFKSVGMSWQDLVVAEGVTSS